MNPRSGNHALRGLYIDSSNRLYADNDTHPHPMPSSPASPKKITLQKTNLARNFLLSPHPRPQHHPNHRRQKPQTTITLKTPPSKGTSSKALYHPIIPTIHTQIKGKQHTPPFKARPPHHYLTAQNASLHNHKSTSSEKDSAVIKLGEVLISASSWTKRAIINFIG